MGMVMVQVPRNPEFPTGCRSDQIWSFRKGERIELSWSAWFIHWACLISLALMIRWWGITSIFLALCAEHYSKSFAYIYSFNPCNISMKSILLWTHFTAEETGAEVVRASPGIISRCLAPRQCSWPPCMGAMTLSSGAQNWEGTSTNKSGS